MTTLQRDSLIPVCIFLIAVISRRMWNPTHVQVTVLRARGLLSKGKNGGNNPFVTIAVGKEKYQTSVKEKVSEDTVVWQEQCELSLAQSDNTTALVLTALHRNGIIDQFLGTVSIPLSSLAVHERPKCRWYKLEGKPGKERGKDKERGELEVRIAFTVKASTGSLMDLSKKEKHKSSMGQLSSKIGGSLLSLGSSEKRAGLKQIAKTIGKKVSGKKRDANGGDGASEKGSQENVTFSSTADLSGKNVDPGVISEDEDEFTFDNLSHKSSGSSLNVNSPMLENLAGGEFLRRSTKGAPAKPPRSAAPPSPTEKVDEWEQKLCGPGNTLKRGTRPSPLASSSPTQHFDKSPILTKSSSIEQTSPVPAIVTVAPSPRPAERRFMSSPNLQKQDSEETKEPSKLSKKLKEFQPFKRDKKEERFIIGEEAASIDKAEVGSRHSQEVLAQFRGQSRDDLITTVLGLQNHLQKSTKQINEMESYLDDLLLRVMETSPRILQRPFTSCKAEFKSH